MIASFKDDATEDFDHGRTSHKVRRFPPNIRAVVLRKLDMLNAAHQLRDLLSPPGKQLEALNKEICMVITASVSTINGVSSSVGLKARHTMCR